MTLRVPRLPFSLDPLIAEANRRARRRRAFLALGVAVGAAVAVIFGLQSGGAPPRGGTGAGSGGAAQSEGPTLADGVAPVTGGRVVAAVIPTATTVGQPVRTIQVAAASIDASGNFVLRPDPTSRLLARAIVKAIRINHSWVNLELLETGADGKMAVTSITRQYVDASGKPVSLAEFRAAPGSGHWIGDGAGGTRVNPKYEIAVRTSASSHS